MPTHPIAANKELLRHFARWFTIPAALYYLLSLYCLFRFHEVIAYAQFPDSAFDSFLYSNTIQYPTYLCSSWPVAPSRLLFAMIPQSLLFGLSVALFIWGFFSKAWMKPANLVLRSVLFVLLIPVTIIFFSFGNFVISLWFCKGGYFYVTSANLPPHTMKTRWLTHYLMVPGRVLATEFDIYKSVGGIGPSSGDAGIALKIPTQDVPRWLSEQRFQLEPGTKEDVLMPYRPLDLQDAAWRHTSTPEYFKGYGASATVYRKEGIILFTIQY